MLRAVAFCSAAGPGREEAHTWRPGTAWVKQQCMQLIH